MALPGSGPLSFSQIQGEFGGANPISMSEYYRGGGLVPSNAASIPTAGAIAVSQFYGTTAYDATPDPFGWNYLQAWEYFYGSVATSDSQTITGFSVPITLRITISCGHLFGPQRGYADGSASVTVFRGGTYVAGGTGTWSTGTSGKLPKIFDVVVQPGDVLRFEASMYVQEGLTGPGDSTSGSFSGDVSAVNLTDGGALIASSGYDLYASTSGQIQAQ